jgi:hypothetical protein
MLRDPGKNLFFAQANRATGITQAEMKKPAEAGF